MPEPSKPALYVVATPIGNLRDITLRALDVLKSVQWIAAEDTRVSARLLAHYGISGPRLFALHAHNEQRMAAQVVERLREGAAVALVSDAGTPAISDPGARVVSAVREAGFAVMPVPGANAAIAALSASGGSDGPFLFCGFLPSRAAERARQLLELSLLQYTLVFYEAPHRVVDSVVAMADVLGAARRVLIARELTKLFEESHACLLGEARAWFEADPNRLKGEFVLVVEGATRARPDDGDARRILSVLLDELPLRQAVAVAVKLGCGRRNGVYELALLVQAESGPAPRQ